MFNTAHSGSTLATGLRAWNGGFYLRRDGGAARSLAPPDSATLSASNDVSRLPNSRSLELLGLQPSTAYDLYVTQIVNHTELGVVTVLPTTGLHGAAGVFVSSAQQTTTPTVVPRSAMVVKARPILPLPRPRFPSFLVLARACL